MPIVTRLSQQKKNNRVNVYLDGKFAFGVTLESALENHLKVGKELSQGKIETLRGKDFKDKIFAKLLSFASRRPHSQKEISLWFKKKNVPEELYVDLFNRLKNIGLLNDEEFARWWVEQRVHFRSSPKKMLKLELRGKGISDEITEKVLGESETTPDIELARKVLVKRFGKIPELVNLKEKKRVYDFLLRRGFSYDTIKQVLAKKK
ncbi:MAG: regulatory protein RecX [Patescibacteria group bacterium]